MVIATEKYLLVTQLHFVPSPVAQTQIPAATTVSTQTGAKKRMISLNAWLQLLTVLCVIHHKTELIRD
jgi:hypothetical protein